MVAQPIEERSALKEVMEWIDRAVQDDGNLFDACEAVAKRAVTAGLVSGLLWDEIGHRALADMWRNDASQQRGKVLRALPGNRRVPADGAELGSGRLEAPIRIGDRWTTIGELNREGATIVAKGYRTQSDELMRRSIIFSEAAKRLTGKKTIAQVFTEEQWLAFVKQVTAE